MCQVRHAAIVEQEAVSVIELAGAARQLDDLPSFKAAKMPAIACTGSVIADASGAAWPGLVSQTTYGVSTVASEADVGVEGGVLATGQRPLRSSLRDRSAAGPGGAASITAAAAALWRSGQPSPAGRGNHTNASVEAGSSCSTRVPLRTTVISCRPGSTPATVADSNSEARAPVDT